MLACNASGFFGLEPRVIEVRARRSLERDVELGAIVRSEEARSDQTGSRQRKRYDERERREADHRKAVIESPSNQTLVVLGLPVEPVVESLECACDRVLVLVCFSLRIGPVRRE